MVPWQGYRDQIDQLKGELREAELELQYCSKERKALVQQRINNIKDEIADLERKA